MCLQAQKQVHKEVAVNINNNTLHNQAILLFTSNIDNLNICCTEENPAEPLVHINDTVWKMCIDVEKDIEMDGVSYRNFLIESPLHTEYQIITPVLESNKTISYLIKPKLQAIPSPDKAKVDRSTSNGTASLYINSKVKDLDILCISVNTNDSIRKVYNNLFKILIDVNKDIAEQGKCSRNYILKGHSYDDCILSVDSVSPNQVLYYTIIESSELVVKEIEMDDTK